MVGTPLPYFNGFDPKGDPFTNCNAAGVYGNDVYTNIVPAVGFNNVPASIFLLLRTQQIGSEVFTCPSSSTSKDLLQHNQFSNSQTTNGHKSMAVTQCGNFGVIADNLAYGLSRPVPASLRCVAGLELFHLDESGVCADG